MKQNAYAEPRTYYEGGSSIKKHEKDDEQESDLPSDLPKPAVRALVAAGYLRLEQFTKLSELEVHKLHGVGPKALGQLRRALAAKGQSFAVKE